MSKDKNNATQETTQGNIPYKHCLNCGAELQGMYCHVCGQEATSKTPTVWSFLLEYANNAFIWDPLFIKTIWTLISRPGRLTSQYLSGKFKGQEHPLKLNMFLLFVFITLFALFAGTEKMNNSVQQIAENEAVQAGIKMKYLLDADYIERAQKSPKDTLTLLAPLFLVENYPNIISNVSTIEDTQGEGLDKWVAVVPHIFVEEQVLIPDDKGYYRVNLAMKVGNEEMDILYRLWEKMVDILNRFFPLLVLFTAPFLTLALRLVQRKSRLPRINHFIFALHYTALLETLMICIYILYLTVAPPIELLNWIMIVGSCLYLTVAFREVYQTRTWVIAALKALFTCLVYLLIMLIILVVIFLVATFILAGELTV